MNYVVFDLEWNQSDTGLEEEAASLPFEIIEIGAVRLDKTGSVTSTFSQLIKPKVYHKMHQITGRLIHLRMQELENGKPFVRTAEGFLEWCGEEPYLFCTWGSSDLTELQRNMRFYHMPPLAEGPFIYLDVQKLFSIAYEDGKSRRGLEHAIDFLEIPKDIPFHRALSDARYTARILERILRDSPDVLKNHSYDVFHPPIDRKAEIKVQFDDYVKYISREFSSKEEAFEDKEVASSKCYLCHRNLRKKIRWFTPNGRNYYCLAYCEKHGYLKGKIRIRKSEDDRIYIVKTNKLISPEDAEALRMRRDRAAELHKRHEEKYRQDAVEQKCRAAKQQGDKTVKKNNKAVKQ